MCILCLIKVRFLEKYFRNFESETRACELAAGVSAKSLYYAENPAEIFKMSAKCELNFVLKKGGLPSRGYKTFQHKLNYHKM